MTTDTLSTPVVRTRGLHRFAVLVALFALAAIVAGAVVTSIERPIAATTAAVTASAAFQIWHRTIALIAGAFMVGLALWLAFGTVQKGLRLLGWAVLAGAVVEAVLGTQEVLRSLLPLSGILHALLAYLFFAAVVVICVLTSESWNREPQRIEDTWRPSMRSLAIALPAIVILQITLGASFRYKALGVLWHIMNAMLVLLLILIVCVFLIRQFPTHPVLRPSAVALAVLTGIQVVLGFTTFLMLLLFPESSPAVIVASALHAGTGALTLAASCVLAVQIRRNLGDRDVTGRSVTAS